MALYNWLLMLSRLVLNVKMHITHTRHSVHTQQINTLTCLSPHSSLMCISLWEFIFYKRALFDPRLKSKEGTSAAQRVKHFLTTRGSCTLAHFLFIWLRRNCLSYLPWGSVHWLDTVWTLSESDSCFKLELKKKNENDLLLSALIKCFEHHTAQ